MSKVDYIKVLPRDEQVPALIAEIKKRNITTLHIDGGSGKTVSGILSILNILDEIDTAHPVEDIRKKLNGKD